MKNTDQVDEAKNPSGEAIESLVSQEQGIKPTLRGWIAPCGFYGSLESRQELESMGIKVGDYDATKNEYVDCEVNGAALDRLDPLWGKYVWGLSPKTVNVTGVESRVSQEQGLVGRELDAAIAERVMINREHVDDGDRFCETCHEEMHEWRMMRFRQQGGNKPEPTPCVPDYSTDIAAAMQVVEKMRGDKWDVQITSDDESPAWYVSFDARDEAGKLLLGESSSDSLPEAICHAALAAVAHNTRERETEITTER